MAEGADLEVGNQAFLVGVVLKHVEDTVVEPERIVFCLIEIVEKLLDSVDILIPYLQRYACTPVVAHDYCIHNPHSFRRFFSLLFVGLSANASA